MTAAVAPPEAKPPLATGLLAALVLFDLALLYSVVGRYGYFRDELYYLACANHLAWGYVDQPPLSIAVLSAVRSLIGDSLPALRLVPALAGASVVLLTGVLAREMGGRRFAQFLAALTVVAAPVYLALSHFYSMNALDLVAWTLAAWVFVRLLRGAPAREWLWLGLAVGVGLLNKISLVWLGAGLGAATLLGPLRTHLRTPWPWLAALVAAFLALPHVLWQVQNGWPTLEFMRNAAEHKMVATPPLQFVMGQVLVMGPANTLVWVAGLVYCLFVTSAKRWRPVALAFLVIAAVLLFAGTSRAYYLTDAYPMVLAAGAVAYERLRGRLGGALRAAMVGLVIVGGAVTAPVGLPLLSPDAMARYAARLGIMPRAEERTAQGELPQHFADMFGWEEMAAKVGRAYQSLSPEERLRCAVFAQNYGEAGALDFFGRRYGLPPALSGHNNYWLWGPRGYRGEVMIVLGGDYEDNASVFESCVAVDTIRCQHCMPYERGVPVYLCRRLKMPLSELWPKLKHYI